MNRAVLLVVVCLLSAVWVGDAIDPPDGPLPPPFHQAVSLRVQANYTAFQQDQHFHQVVISTNIRAGRVVTVFTNNITIINQADGHEASVFTNTHIAPVMLFFDVNGAFINGLSAVVPDDHNWKLSSVPLLDAFGNAYYSASYRDDGNISISPTMNRAAMASHPHISWTRRICSTVTGRSPLAFGLRSTNHTLEIALVTFANSTCHLHNPHGHNPVVTSHFAIMHYAERDGALLDHINLETRLQLRDSFVGKFVVQHKTGRGETLIGGVSTISKLVQLLSVELWPVHGGLSSWLTIIGNNDGIASAPYVLAAFPHATTFFAVRSVGTTEVQPHTQDKPTVYYCNGAFFGMLDRHGSVGYHHCIHTPESSAYVVVTAAVYREHSPYVLMSGAWDCSTSRSLYLDSRVIIPVDAHLSNGNSCGFFAVFDANLERFVSGQAAHVDITGNAAGLSAWRPFQLTSAAWAKTPSLGRFHLTTTESIAVHPNPAGTVDSLILSEWTAIPRV